MSDPFIGEIRMFGGNFAPVDWAFCDGGRLPISQYDSLFSLIGTTYGGDGESTFQVPDLLGRVPIHRGNGYAIGQQGGSETVTLSTQQLPGHIHPAQAVTATGQSSSPSGNMLSGSPSTPLYRVGPPDQPMHAGTVGPAGESQPHDNMMPALAISFIIALAGVYPSRG